MPAGNPVQRPFYGVLLAPTLVLSAYGSTHVSPDHLYRPLGAFLLVTAAAVGLIGFVTGRWHAASFAASLALFMVTGVWPLFWLLAAPWMFLLGRALLRHEGLGVTPLLTRPMNTVTTAWFVVASLTAAVASLPHGLSPVAPASFQPQSNVYLILLDGYPRHDSLQEYFGYDNRPFLDALEQRGFEVAEHSGSHYPGTIQTVPTMMQMRPLEQLLDGDWDGSNAQHRTLWHLLNTGPVQAAYKAAGYTTYSIPSSAAGLDWRTADVVLESPWLSSFELHLAGDGILRFVLPVHAIQRASILDAFDYLESAAGVTPRFVFAHILSPHSPYIFAADGGPAGLCGHECTNHAGPPNRLLGERLIGQVEFLNERVLAAVDGIIEADPDGTVIVFSDHGLRRDRADMDEWFRILFAARGHDFPDDVTTLDVFPALLREVDRPQAGP